MIAGHWGLALGARALWLHRPVVGLNLYRWPAVDFVLELPLVVGGWWMVRRAQGARWAVAGAGPCTA